MDLAHISMKIATTVCFMQLRNKFKVWNKIYTFYFILIWFIFLAEYFVVFLILFLICINKKYCDTMFIFKSLSNNKARSDAK